MDISRGRDQRDFKEGGGRVEWKMNQFVGIG